MSEQIHETGAHAISASAAKLAPAAIVSGGIFAGVDWPTVVLIMTAILIAIQIGYNVWRWIADYRDRNHDRRKHDRGHKPERRK